MLIRENDVGDDAAKAYAEVMGRTEGAAPVERAAPVEKAAKVEPATNGKDTSHVEAKAPKAEAKEAPDKGDKTSEGRDAKGRFAGKTGTEGAKPEGKAGAEAAATEGKDAVAPEGEAKVEAAAPAVGPPPSWSVKSKALWEQIPNDVRSEIVKREGEVAQGLSALRDFKDLKPYAELAAKHNTTIAKALERYTGLENVLKQDLGTGLAVIAENYGLSKAQAGHFFAALAQRYGVGTGPGPAPTAGVQNDPHAQPDPFVESLRPMMRPLLDEISSIKSQLGTHTQASQERQVAELAQAIERFAADPANRYFPDVEKEVMDLFERKIVPLTGDFQGDFRKAYDIATRMNPEISEALIEQRLAEERSKARSADQEAANKAKAASRSLTGTRMPGTTIKDSAEHTNRHDEIESVVRAAYRQHQQA